MGHYISEFLPEILYYIVIPPFSCEDLKPDILLDIRVKLLPCLILYAEGEIELSLILSEDIWCGNSSSLNSYLVVGVQAIHENATLDESIDEHLENYQCWERRAKVRT